MINHVSCTTAADNSFCPEGTIWPQQCGIGLYVSTDHMTCETCPLGKYCWPCPAGQYCFTTASSTGTGHNGEEGDCDGTKGFICREGSFSPEPLYNGYDLIQSGSAAFNSYSGPIIRGYILNPDLSDNPGELLACDPGTYQPSFYATECKKCMKGRYCPDSAMTDISDNLCDSGHWCLEGLTVSNPTNEIDPDDGVTVIGDICSQGKFCSGNLIDE